MSKKSKQIFLRKKRPDILKISLSAIAVLVIVLAVYRIAQQKTESGVQSFEKTDAESYIYGPIHWHVQVDITICGKKTDLPKLISKNPEAYIGWPQLHTHSDNRLHLHIEKNMRYKKSEVSLGKFMDAINVPFDRDRIFDYKNGMRCPNSTTPGTVKFFVMGTESDLYRNHVPVDGQIVQIVFA